MSDYPVELEDLYAGTTFHYRKNSLSKPHLYIILTEPERIKGAIAVVSVNITTQRQTKRGSDTTVILNIGDHPFITAPSVASYVDAEFFSTEKLLRYINEERSLSDDIEDDVLRKIQQGLLTSDFTPVEILEYCKKKFIF